MEEAFDDSTTGVSGDADVPFDKTLRNALSKLQIFVNEIYENREQFADDVHIQQVVINARQQAERACILVQDISSNKLNPEVAPSCAPDDDSVISFLREDSRVPLTKRELEVLALLREGYTNKQAAFQMNVSPRTVECYRAEAKRKLGARNTAELVLKALQLSQENELRADPASSKLAD